MLTFLAPIVLDFRQGKWLNYCTSPITRIHIAANLAGAPQPETAKLWSLESEVSQVGPNLCWEQLPCMLTHKNGKRALGRMAWLIVLTKSPYKTLSQLVVEQALSQQWHRGAGARGAVDSVLEDLVDLVDGSDALLRSEDVAVQDAVAHLVHYIIVTCGPACTLEQE
eukprot:scaffold151739_cov16-Tisochrysis_lutea.AAC.1